MAAKAKTYSIHGLVLLFVLFWPMLLGYIKYQQRESPEDTSYNKPDLAGLVISDEKPKFSWDTWFSGSYQDEAEDYHSDHWAMKEFMVRANNQFYYKAFNQIRVNGFVLGKENYIFSESYIFSAFGDDLVAEPKISELLRKARVIQDTLKKKGVDLLLVYAPGKGAYCREFVEDKYVHPVANTNYSIFIKHSREMGLNHLDLYGWFEQMKAGTKYPLFPRFGHHWSYYGECLAVDTIVRHIEHLHRCDLPEIQWASVEVSDTARSRDADALRSMNLLHDPPQNMQLAYPQLQFESDTLKNRHKVLTISDSYWYGPVYMGVPQAVFGGGQFWYYYNKVVPSPRPGEKVEVWELDLKQEIESSAVVMLLYSDGNLPTFGNNFINDVYEMYTAPEKWKTRNEREKQIQFYAKEIRNTPMLLKRTTLKSRELKIPLDSAIRQEARRMAGLTQNAN